MTVQLMRKSHLLKGWLGFSIAVVLFCLAITSCSNNIADGVESNRTLKFSNVKFVVDVADTQALRTKGLSGSKSLDLDRGLLFDFKEDGKYGIWMKDMNYSLDIIWLDSNMNVVHVEQSISPKTFPKVFTSSTPSRYVLEINSGLSKKYEIVKGSKAQLSNLKIEKARKE